MTINDLWDEYDSCVAAIPLTRNPLSASALAARNEIEQSIASTYIPLVEAAREYIRLWNEPKNGDSSLEQWRAMNVATAAIEAALVQVPGQQQADTGGG